MFTCVLGQFKENQLFQKSPANAAVNNFIDMFGANATVPQTVKHV